MHRTSIHFPKVGACPLDGREQVTCSAASSQPCAEVHVASRGGLLSTAGKNMGHLAHSHMSEPAWNWDFQPQQSCV